MRASPRSDPELRLIKKLTDEILAKQNPETGEAIVNAINSVQPASTADLICVCAQSMAQIALESPDEKVMCSVFAAIILMYIREFKEFPPSGRKQ